MAVSVKEIIETYNPDAPLAEASTPPSSWYVDPRILELERSTVFARSWQMVGRADQVREPGQYITCELAGSQFSSSEVTTAFCADFSMSAVTTLLR